MAYRHLSKLLEESQKLNETDDKQAYILALLKDIERISAMVEGPGAQELDDKLRKLGYMLRSGSEYPPPAPDPALAKLRGEATISPTGQKLAEQGGAPAPVPPGTRGAQQFDWSKIDPEYAKTRGGTPVSATGPGTATPGTAAPAPAQTQAQYKITGPGVNLVIAYVNKGWSVYDASGGGGKATLRAGPFRTLGDAFGHAAGGL